VKVPACGVGGCSAPQAVEMGLFFLDAETKTRTDLSRPMRPNMMMCEEHARTFARSCWTRIELPVGGQAALRI
jgi:hypothetical protein